MNTTTETLIHNRTTDELFLTIYTPERYALAFGLTTETATVDGDWVTKYLDSDGNWIATAQVVDAGDNITIHRL